MKKKSYLVYYQFKNRYDKTCSIYERNKTCLGYEKFEILRNVLDVAFNNFTDL